MTQPSDSSKNVAILIRVMVALLLAHAIFAGLVAGFASLALRLSARQLFLPCLLIVMCGAVLAPLLFWAWLGRARPGARAFRTWLAMFAYLQLFALAVLESGIWLGFLSRDEALSGFLPFLSFSMCLASALVYAGARRYYRTIDVEP